jgi:hypothetical protein
VFGIAALAVLGLTFGAAEQTGYEKSGTCRRPAGGQGGGMWVLFGGTLVGRLLHGELPRMAHPLNRHS